MGQPLHNQKHESFARAVILEGRDPEEAYTEAGFGTGFRNHNKLLNKPFMRARMAELEQEREAIALASQTSIADVLAELEKHGVDRVTDFFESGSDGQLHARNLRTLRPQIARCLLDALHEATGMNWHEAWPPEERDESLVLIKRMGRWKISEIKRNPQSGT